MTDYLRGTVNLAGIHSPEDQKQVIAAEWRRKLPPGMRVKDRRMEKRGDVLHYTLELEPRKVMLNGVEL